MADQIAPDRLRADRSGGADLLAGAGRLLRHWRVLLGLPLVAAAVVFAVVALQPDRFTATSTVVVVPPAVTTSLSADDVMSTGLQQLAMADYVIDRVEQHLRADGALDEGDSAGTFVARLRESGPSANPYLSLIMLDVTAADPELARQAANKWAEVLVAEERSIAARSTTFILSEFPKATEEFERAEHESQSLAEKQARELAAVKGRAAVSLQTARLHSREAAAVRIDDLLDSTRLEQTRYGAEIEQLTKELEATPSLIEVSRTVPDVLSTGSPAGNGSAPAGESSSIRIAAQEVNPVHSRLAWQLAQARVRYQGAVAQIASLEAQRKNAMEEAEAARTDLLQGEMLVAMTIERHEREVAEQARRLEQSRSRFTYLSEKVGEAGVAASSSEGNLRVGGLATGATAAESSAGMAAGIAFVGALIAALIGLWLLEYLNALSRAR